MGLVLYKHRRLATLCLSESTDIIRKAQTIIVHGLQNENNTYHCTAENVLNHVGLILHTFAP